MNGFVSFIEGLRMWAARANMGELLNAASVLAGEFRDRGLEVTFKLLEKEGGHAEVSFGDRHGPAPSGGAGLGGGDRG